MSLEEVDAMPFEEFCQWMAFYEWNPFGDLRLDYHFACLMSLIANINRDPKRRRKAFAPYEFLLDFTGQAAQAKEEMRRREEVLYLKSFFDRLHARQKAADGGNQN